MILADDFMKAADLAPPDAVGDSYRYIAHLIGEARRFNVTDEALDACRDILQSRPSSILLALDYARLPFPIVWMEWNTPNEGKPLPKGQHPARRSGALLRQDGHRIRIFTGWKLAQSPEGIEMADRMPSHVREFARAVVFLGISAVEAAIDFNVIKGRPSIADGDWHVLHNILDDREAVNRAQAELRKGSQQFRHALSNEADLQALKRIEHSVLWRINRETNGYDVIARNPSNQEIIIRDVRDDLGPLLAMLIMMNCRNAVEIAAVEPPAKLNKARRSRGQSALVSYSTIHVHLMRHEARAAAAGEGVNRPVARHEVRGHFKVRRSGVFYWRTHERGSEDAGKRHHDYRVEV